MELPAHRCMSSLPPLTAREANAACTGHGPLQILRTMCRFTASKSLCSKKEESLFFRPGAPLAPLKKKNTR